ncbi:MAG: tetratricopeptide repeat protein, partial [Verrucomicrobiota bacterium]
MDISQLLSALEASPDNIPLILMVAQAYEDEFELEKANELIEQGLGFEPENEALILKKIHLLDLEGKTSEAVIRLEVLLGQAANNAQAHMLMARLLFKEENPKEAFKHYQRAVGIDNNLRDDELLGEITKAGGAVGGAVRSDGSFDFDLDDDEDIPFEDLEGIDAMKAHDLGLEYEAISDIDFSGVGGMTDVKEDIQMKIIFPLENPELYKSYGKKAGGGVLMYGPPGCGKTLLSRATAGEIKSGFFSQNDLMQLIQYTPTTKKTFETPLLVIPPW